MADVEDWVTQVCAYDYLMTPPPAGGQPALADPNFNFNPYSDHL